MTTYAITGASGQLGRLAIRELLDRGVSAADVVAIVRTLGKAGDLAEEGVQVREADYTQPDRLTAALQGVDRLLLISSSEAGQRVAQHTNVIEAARSTGTGRIVYTSMLNADDTSNPLAGEHQDTERALRASSVPFTLLRNGWYTENYTEQLDQYLESGQILGAAGRGRISAAVALLRDADGNPTYELGGPAFDLDELAQVITRASPTTVTYTDLSVDAYATRLEQAGLEHEQAQFVAALDASIANGDLETDSHDLESLLSRPVIPMAEIVHAALTARSA